MTHSISQSQQILAQQTLARALAAHQAGDLAQAEQFYKLVLKADRKQFDALHMLGVIEAQRGNFAAGLARINDALRVRPKSPEALINLGRLQGELGQYREAEATYNKALALDPRSALAHSNLAIVLRLHGKPEAALGHADAALKIAPQYADAWNNRGNALFDLRRFAAALDDYDRAAALQPNHGRAHVNRGNALAELKNHHAALDAYRRALGLDANLAEAHLGCGKSLFALKQHDDAVAAFDRAVAVAPDLAAAWQGRGSALSELRRYPEALEAFDRALAAAPDLAEAWYGRGAVFSELRRYADAAAAFGKALALDPAMAYAPGYRLHAKLHLCDWTDLDAEIEQLLSELRAGRPVSTPFPILSVPSSAADQLRCARGFDLDLTGVRDGAALPMRQHDRIRVAYASSDLREHAVAFLMAGLFEQHDRSRFATTAISFGTAAASPFGDRIERAFERFVDVSGQSDQEVAALIRQLEIDILVDLNGHTRNGRLGVFARRPASIQVNYLGYPGTMGADFYDYIVGDAVVIPPGQFDCYSEQVVWLPDSFLVNDTKRAVPPRLPTRRELDLPDAGFVFCCFNQSYKIDPAIFDLWMRLLRTVEGSVLWLKENDLDASRNLRREAERRGVVPERLVFAPSVPDVTDHLARQKLADLFLDTLNYNAHTTASEALWVGVPVVTCIGSTFAGRVAASLLQAIGLPELVTGSLADYEALALALARDPERLDAIKTRLAGNRARYPLFDTARFTRHIEAAYTTMWQRHQRGEAPGHFAVAALP